MQLLSRNNQSLKLIFAVVFLCLLHSCRKGDHWPPKPKEESADVVYAWYKFIAKLQLPANPQPVVLLNLRNFGYIGVGLYESVRPGIKGAASFSTKLYQMPQMPVVQPGEDYLWNASANAALASMFKQFLAGLSNANRTSIDSMELANYNRFKSNVPEAVLTRSQDFGRSIANAIYNWSTSDNFILTSVGWIPPVFPGSYIPTPPNFPIPVGPFLKDSRPFTTYALTATAPPLPFPYSEDPASEFYKAAKDVYDVGRTLTTEQKAIADWWHDSGGPCVGVPYPYHALSIITWVLENQGAKLGQAAENYAKTGIAMKDGPITVFRAKYQYNILRPISYIHKYDPTWQAYVVTPPYPDYPSGLAGVVTPIIQVLIRAFGDIPATDNSYNFRGLPSRHYTSLSQMAEEAAVSRVYAGIHYRFTQYITLDMGRQLGNHIADINVTGSPKH